MGAGQQTEWNIPCRWFNGIDFLTIGVKLQKEYTLFSYNNTGHWQRAHKKSNKLVKCHNFPRPRLVIPLKLCISFLYAAIAYKFRNVLNTVDSFDHTTE